MADSQEQSLEQEIRDDARKRAERLERRAERQADQAVQEARQEAQRIRERILREARDEIAHMEEVHGSRVQQEIGRRRRQAFEDILEHVRRCAHQRMLELAEGAGEDYRDLLVRLACAAVEAMEGREFQLKLDTRDRERWGQQLPERVRRSVKEQLGREVAVEVADDTFNGCAGLEVRGGRMHQVADQTLEARLQRLWSDLRVDLADMLKQEGQK